jgi:hypothetical protein
MTLHQKQAHFTQMFASLIHYALSLGLEPVIDMVARSPEEQARLVKSGASQTLDSKHVLRLAGDLLLFKDGVYLTDGAAYKPLGMYWCALDPHNVWGGSWQSIKDFDHFEYNG